MNRLTDHAREEIVSRILLGETLISLGSRTVKLTTPNPTIRVMANKLYSSIIHQHRFDKYWLSDKQCLKILVDNNICSASIDSNIIEIQKEIDQSKVNVYLSIFSNTENIKYRKILNNIRAKYNEMLTNRHMFDHLTLHGYAEMVKRQYVLLHTTFDFDTNKPLWNSMESMDTITMEQIIASNIKNMISIEDIREVARTDPWKGYWAITNGKPFSHIQPCNLSEEQKSLTLFSIMYENITKHPECPPDSIIEDDDAFDGWMIIQRRQREKDQLTAHLNPKNKNNSKANDAQEVYTVAKDKDQVKRIYSLNDTQAQMTIKQRNKQIVSQGKVDESQMMDRKLEIQAQSNELFKQKFRS